MAFPTTLDSDFGTLVDNTDDIEASQMNEIRRAVEGIEAKVGIDSSAVTTSLDYMVNNFFENGRRLWLYEDAAPTGWTYLASIADRVIGIKGGSNAFNVAGGNQAGTWTRTTIAHTHDTGHVTSGSGGADWSSSGVGQKWLSSGFTTGSTGGASNTWRPYGAVGIIVEKD